MKVSNKAISDRLVTKGFAPNHSNTLAISDELECDYDKSDYESIDDAVDDAIEELAGMGRITA